MEKIRFGVIGLGNQGTHYTLDLFAKGKIENGYITALCDNNPAKINIMKAKNEDKTVAYFEKMYYNNTEILRRKQMFCVFYYERLFSTRYEHGRLCKGRSHPLHRNGAPWCPDP